ncbi:hypothetical protein DSO57_1000938 [Entomophthora muscae]|uniref:Uncharacterized protein n=1 Tax=Entomophthora muscae TaxID=34485 RepID=A0ACC2TK24_9FUNG|nr:hypothetical protein DSO57_1000938 [Entomophthora muscae]
MVNTTNELFELSKPAQVILGMSLMSVGLFFLFAGKIFIRVVAAISMSLVFWVLSFIVVVLVGGRGNHVSTISLVLCVIAASIGGGVGLFYFKLATFATGALSGFMLTAFLFSTALSGIKSHLTFYICAAIVSLGSGVATSFAFKYLIVAFSAFTGAFSFMVGVDTFSGTGLWDYLFSLREARTLVYPNTPTIAMLTSILILALIGTAIQIRFLSKPTKEPPSSELEPIFERISLDSIPTSD